MDKQQKPKQIHLLHADSLGGGPVVVAQHLRHFSSTWEVELWCGGDGFASQTARELGVKVRKFRLQHRLLALLQIPRLALALRREQPDVLVLHGQWAGALGAWAARLTGFSRVVYIAHCPAFYHSTNLLRSVRNYFAEKWPCQVARRVVALSEGSHYGYLYRGWAPEEALVLIHNGVNPGKQFGPEEVAEFRRSYLVPADGIHAVFVGRLDDQKRVDWLVRAWSEAMTQRADTDPPWHLWIVGGGSGSGNREAEVRQLVDRLGLQSTVHFMGHSKEADMWIGAADFLVLSSLYEGHALVPLEAMVKSKPVVAFHTDGITDSIENGVTGLLAELGNTCELGQMIARMARDPELRASCGAAGRQKLEEEFSLQKSLACYENVYREVAGKNH
jgi:glycosyltransferase involved in cell wall biosynthesis